ncbi:MAG TPA: hypothetical protein VKR83_20250 [Ktedonobacteraceae bacterium]|nr:hypothetical protein [Ktedonobacteraceae bacterium]
MECSEPGLIRDEELLAYLAGERVRSVVGQHLAHCQRCSSWVAENRGLERSLIQKLYRWDCPPNQILGEYQMGLLSSDVAAAVRLHLNRCVFCAAEMATLIEFLANDPMLVESFAVQSSSQNNHSDVKQNVQRVLEGLRERSTTQAQRIIATLLPQQPRLAYQRHIANSEVWPRRYTAEDFSISVQVERGTERNDALQLIGLVTRKGATLEALQGIPVSLSSQTSPVYTQTIDELGNFVFSSISPSTYTLELQLPDSTIVIEQLPVDLQD